MQNLKPPQANTQRRRFIRLLGGGAVFAATVPLSGCSTDYRPSSVQAWQGPGNAADLRTWMLAHALLAPNPHNRQPWIADLRTPGQITLICDGERLLPETDPFGRQILIGCGAFIELAVMAAAERGHRVRVEPFPEGEPAPHALPGGKAVARLVLQADASVTKDPLFAFIRQRHTHKGPYDPQRTVAAPLWATLQNEAEAQGLRAGAVTEAQGMARLREITRAAFETEMLTPRTYLESAHLMRIGPSEVDRHRDGIALMGGMVQTLAGLGLFDRFEVPQRGSSNFEHTMKRWLDFESASGYLWMASPNNSRGSQLQTGRAYVRAHLQATAAGVDMHPLSQAVQEFAEMRPQFEALHELLGQRDTGRTGTVQMLARVGYGLRPIGPSPRRDLDQLLQT